MEVREGSSWPNDGESVNLTDAGGKLRLRTFNASYEASEPHGAFKSVKGPQKGSYTDYAVKFHRNTGVPIA